jgi:hypothetical protein
LRETTGIVDIAVVRAFQAGITVFCARARAAYTWTLAGEEFRVALFQDTMFLA